MPKVRKILLGFVVMKRFLKCGLFQHSTTICKLAELARINHPRVVPLFFNLEHSRRPLIVERVNASFEHSKWPLMVEEPNHKTKASGIHVSMHFAYQEQIEMSG